MCRGKHQLAGIWVPLGVMGWAHIQIQIIPGVRDLGSCLAWVVLAGASRNLLLKRTARRSIFVGCLCLQDSWAWVGAAVGRHMALQAEASGEYDHVSDMLLGSES